MRGARTLVLALLVACISGCAVRGPSEVRLDGSQYAAAFDAARRALVDSRFELDRVDARAGVITTQPKATAGAATPWDREQTTPRQELEDLANKQQRRVRITFEPVEHGANEPTPDLRTLQGPLIAHVEVAVDRIHRPGLVLEPTAPRFSGRAVSRRLAERGMHPEYEVSFSRDDELARRLAAQIRSSTQATSTPADSKSASN